MLAKTLKFKILKSPNKPTLMTNILTNYFRVLEVTSSLNCELEYKSGLVKFIRHLIYRWLHLVWQLNFISIDSENTLFISVDVSQILNLIEGSQFNKRRRKLFLF